MIGTGIRRHKGEGATMTYVVNWTRQDGLSDEERFSDEGDAFGYAQGLLGLDRVVSVTVRKEPLREPDHRGRRDRPRE
jgi:hypothetical protein